MEEQWRRCIRTGGAPDFILGGSAFIDAYRQYGISGLMQNTDAGAVKKLDAPVIPWEKRCYFLNTKHIELRDDDMDIVSPTRPYNVLALYQMINLRLALVLKKSNAHSVLAIV